MFHTSSPQQALTSKVVMVKSVNGLSPDFLAMTVAVVEPFTILFIAATFLSVPEMNLILMTFPVCSALAGGSYFSATQGLCVSTDAVRF